MAISVFTVGERLYWIKSCKKHPSVNSVLFVAKQEGHPTCVLLILLFSSRIT